MAGFPGSAGKAYLRRVFLPRSAALPASPAASQPAEGPSWLSELSAPDALARWASSFGDVRSCLKACTDPEWLLWLAARTAGPGEARRPVVLCAAEVAGLAHRGRRPADPRVARAISVARMWAGQEADVSDLLAAELGALEAAQESVQAAEQEAERARALFKAAPRRRPSSFGMSRALGAWQWWREAERCSCLALAAASVARAAALAADTGVTDVEWAACVSQSASYTMQAMAPVRPGDRQPRYAMRRCVRLAKRRLAVS